MKKILGTLLGAGQGFLGSLIRTGLATVGGVLVAHGVDPALATNLEVAIAGAAMAALAALGSYLNNEVNK